RPTRCGATTWRSAPSTARARSTSSRTEWRRSMPADVLQEAHERVREAYGGAIGRRRTEVVTPALILDLPAARRNIDAMAARMAELPADLRPHIKVHKSPELARMQVAAGAIGVSTATVWEAMVMAQAGLDGIFVVSTIGVLVELDTGMDRAGVDSTAAAVELAERISAFDGLRLCGVSGYEGHCS